MPNPIAPLLFTPSTESTLPPPPTQELVTSPPAARQDRMEMRLQKKPGCLARLKEKIVEFLRRVISCLCCRSSKAEPVPGNPTTTEQPAPVIIPPSEPPLDQGGAVVPPRNPDKTIRKDESKKQLDEPEVESSEELIDFFEEQPVYRLAMQYKEDFSSLPHITDEEIIQFKKDFSPIIQILIVALQATPIGYQEGKIHIFYRQLDAAYRSADIPPQALSIDNIPKLQNHLLLQAKALFDKQFVEEFLARAKKEKREGKAQEPGEGTSIALASAPESDEEDSDIEEIE